MWRTTDRFGANECQALPRQRCVILVCVCVCVVVVLVHQLQHFSDRYHVVAVDMRGYGESSKPGPSWWYSKRFSSDTLIEVSLPLPCWHGVGRAATQ